MKTENLIDGRIWAKPKVPKNEFHVDKGAENPTDFILYLEEK